MVFSDLFFLFVFLPAFALCYLAAAWIDRQIPMEEAGEHSHLFQNSVLVIFSLIFYAWGEPVYVFLMLFCVLVNYLAGLGINSQTGGARRWALAAGLTGNILILSTFKYLSFFAQQLNTLGVEVADPKISLPIGISFYTFQSISYLIDVYRREAPVQRHFGNLLLYISMFPQLIAGPIVRYNTVAREINNRHISSSDVAEGMYRFMIGLGKKVILANQLSEISDQFLANSLQDLTTTGSWVGIVAFTLQIYFDFSGYSDMAIGLGRCLGFHFNENFRHPYCCNSITDFWRRWHISLGSFFRDYVYIPLGGNRCSMLRNILNTLIVWALTGLWHGASWNFVLWGLYWFVFLMLERLFLKKLLQRVPVLPHLDLVLIVFLGWILFRFTDIRLGWTVVKGLFGLNGNAASDFLSFTMLENNLFLLLISAVACTPLPKAVSDRLAAYGVWAGCRKALFPIVLLLLSTCALVGESYNPFLYFQF